ncbi:MAG: DNA polymerase III subunit chi [Hydrogenophaga sp.]|jgi:DNA polymerase-3 subunit chi|nr:DNA polymerase III subunit chi [Hydrogenophaga sp.]
MTEVDFHFNAPDKQAYACRLLRKAYLKGARLVVVTEPDALTALDAALWTFSTEDFLPHCREGDAAHVLKHSPILLCSAVPTGVSGRAAAVLVNLRADMPRGYERFGRVIEVVATAQEDRESARARWMQYRGAGIEPNRHDLRLAPQG